MTQDMGHAYAANVEQNVREMQTSAPRSNRQVEAVKEIQREITRDPEIGTVLH